MKNLISKFAFLFLCLCSCVPENKNEPINVMSFNIRYDNSDDGDNQWTYRKDFAADLIKFHQIDILGCQEVLHHQLTDLLERLPGFDYIGVGRKDGKEAGEYSPILYDTTRFAVEKNGNFWLSENPNLPGKLGWDAACERVATWGIFKDKFTGKKFFYLNTHLDHMGKVARHEGAKLVLEQSKLLSEGLPILLSGDYNANPSDEPIQVLTNEQDPDHVTDVRHLTELTYGPKWTFHNFGRYTEDEKSCLDYIFVKGDYRIYRFGVLTDKLNDIYPSDHCPIMATIALP